MVCRNTETGTTSVRKDKRCQWPTAIISSAQHVVYAVRTNFAFWQRRSIILNRSSAVAFGNILSYHKLCQLGQRNKQSTKGLW